MNPIFNPPPGLSTKPKFNLPVKGLGGSGLGGLGGGPSMNMNLSNQFKSAGITAGGSPDANRESLPVTARESNLFSARDSLPVTMRESKL